MTCRPSRFRSIALVAPALFCSVVSNAVPVPSTQPASVLLQSGEITQTIAHLASEDPAVRDQATQQLLQGGFAVRPQVLAAMRWRRASPELRARCATILLKLPWSSADDASIAGQTLKEYNQPLEELRVRLIGRLAEASNGGGREALFRLLHEEPSTTVRWAIVGVVRQMRDDPLLQTLRQMDPGDDAPRLVAAGYAWLQRDPQRAMALFKRAADLEWNNPTDDHPTSGEQTEHRFGADRSIDDIGEMDWVFELLYAKAINRGAIEEAAAVLRQQTWRHLDPPDDENGLPLPLLNLFVLHAQYGPLSGFQQDARSFASYMGEPEIIFTIGKMYQRLGQALAADACYRAASAASVGRQLGHRRAGEFLLRRGWYDLAEQEFLATLACTGPDKVSHDANAYVGLSRAAGGMGDDQVAASRMQRALDTAQANMPNAKISQLFVDEIHWHELRAAMEKGDTAQIDLKLTGLLGVEPVNSEMTLDLICALKLRGRDQEAANLFNPLFTNLKKLVDADPNNAEYLNNLAWVCARCREHADLAVEWSRRAIDAAPGNPAYLDTAGEANFVANRPQEAARYESEALKLQPGDKFMLKQLRKFLNAAAAGKR